MRAFEKAWKLLKGNPYARVQESDARGYSEEDYAIHPAALGAANRQVFAEMENQRKLQRFAQQQGQRMPQKIAQKVSRQMVTPEQRASMKNTSFNLQYRHPKFISIDKPPKRPNEVTSARSAGEIKAEIQAKKDATARRKKMGRDKRGRRLPKEEE